MSTIEDTIFPLEPLSERYDIEYTLLKKEDNKYRFKKSGELNDALKGPKEKTTLGRNPQQDSIFYDNVNFPLEDITVSRKHIYIAQNELGLVYVDISVNGSRIINYKREEIIITKKKPGERIEVTKTLVPANFDEDNTDIFIFFGEGYPYQLKITLERKIEIGQLKK